MPAKIDITGRKFNHLTAIKQSSPRDKNGNVKWIFLCKCGKEVEKNRGDVTFGRTTSCGCNRFKDKFVKLKKHYQISDKGCWEWTGSIDQNGYGVMNIAKKHKRAHRISYECFYGKIPENSFICHHCDNRKCINPEHIYCGDSETNSKDMDDRKRRNALKGEENPRSRLKNDDVLKIRELYKQGVNGVELSKLFNCPHTLIYSIINRKLWRHI